LTTSNMATLCNVRKVLSARIRRADKKCSHGIKKSLTPKRLMFRDGRGRVDVSSYFEGYDFAVGERLYIEVVYATVICGLPL
jgi:hypothetical protein